MNAPQYRKIQTGEYQKQRAEFDLAAEQENLKATDIDEKYHQKLMTLEERIMNDPYLDESKGEKSSLFEQTKIFLDQDLRDMRLALASVDNARINEKEKYFLQAIVQLDQLIQETDIDLSNASDRNYFDTDTTRGSRQITDQEFLDMSEENIRLFLTDQKNQTIWNIERIQRLGIQFQIPQDIQYVEVSSPENLRDQQFNKTGKRAMPGQKYQIIGHPSKKWGLDYVMVMDQFGDRYLLCVDSKEQKATISSISGQKPQQSNAGIAHAAEYNPSIISIEDEVNVPLSDQDAFLKERGFLDIFNFSKPPDFSRYSRSLNPELIPEKCERIFEYKSPPWGFSVELSENTDSFQYYLENYPIGEGDLNYEPKTVRYLNSKMPTEEAMDDIMSKVRADLMKLAKNGEWDKIRVSKQYFDNQFNNQELVAMVAGWMMGKDIRRVNYYKSVFTDGKLNLSILNNQDCVDSCIRLRLEYLLGQKDYNTIREYGIDIKPGMSNEEIDRAFSEYFRSTHTGTFAQKHHELGHMLTDEQIEQSDLELEVGDFITFNEKGRVGGHTVVVMAKARNKSGKCVYRIATSTLPATEMSLYKGWVTKDDLIGGSALANHLSILPGIGGVMSVFVDKGLKSEGHTISIGTLNSQEREIQVASRETKERLSRA